MKPTRFIVDVKDEDPEGDLVYYSEYEALEKVYNMNREAIRKYKFITKWLEEANDPYLEAANEAWEKCK